MTLFIGQGLFRIFPYAQIAVGDRARSLVPFTLSEFILFLVVNGAYIFVFYTLAVRQLKKGLRPCPIKRVISPAIAKIADIRIGTAKFFKRILRKI